MADDEDKWCQSIDTASEQQWQQQYNNVENLEEHINNQMRLWNQALNASQEKYSRVLATIGMIRDDPKSVLKEHGILYKWHWQYTREMNQDGEACCAFNHMSNVEKQLDNENACLLPDGWRWMLQVKAGDRWYDWVYIKASNRMDKYLGLFAGRDFPRGSILGFLIGPNVLGCEMSKEDEASQICYYQTTTRQSAFPLKVKDNNGYWNSIQLLRVDKCPGIPLYLGLHYINSACQFFKFGTKEFEAARKHQNCMINDDGSLQTLKNITKDVELLAGFNSAEQKEEKCINNKKIRKTSSPTTTAMVSNKRQCKIT